MRRKKYFIPLLIFLACGGFLTFRACGAEKMDTFYRTQRVINNQLRVAVSATGTINPVSVVSVGTQISGTILRMLVDFNDQVREGQLLLTLDDELFRAKVQMTEANLASAQAQEKLAQVKYDRQAKLFAQGSSPREDVDTAQANLDMAKATVAQSLAQLAQDQYNLNNTQIVSPVDGVVINRAVDVGQTVAASFQTPTLIDIAQDLSKMQINASFAEADIGRLTPGLAVSFTVDAFPGQTFSGVVRQIRLNPIINSNVVTYDVVVDVQNPDLTLLPGMTAYVDIELYREDNVLLVPNSALNFRPPEDAANANGAGQAAPPPAAEPESAALGAPPNGAPALDAPSKSLQGVPSKDDLPTSGRVYVLGKDQRPKAVELTLGATDLRYTVVKSGALQAGDMVIISEDVAQTTQSTLLTPGRAGPAPGRR
ncbi:MAG: efflux RND transporter periplasmic adaptor subunit [Deltaproteobacteria bacterium]|jgi:HlyD family secretion protein|nr:efflux RND transporter periplasmic adaptor subunit [Deltaproteobacteria bacterium]